MDYEGDELSLRDYLNVVRRRGLVVVVIVLVAVVLTILYTTLQTPIYEAEAQMLVSTRDTDSLFKSGTDLRGSDATRQLQTEIQILEGERIRSLVIEQLQLDEEPPPVKASVIGNTDVLAVRVRDPDGTTAATLANTYVTEYIENRRQVAIDDRSGAIGQVQEQVAELDKQIDGLKEDDPLRQKLVDQNASLKQIVVQLTIDASLSTGGASLVERAAQPTTPVEPRPARSAVLAGVLGLMVGLGVAFGLDYFDDAIHSEEELEQISGQPVLAAVPPTEPTKSQLPVSVIQPDLPASEAYRGLRTNIQFLSIDRQIKSIVVTSATIGEGKSTTAANLAVVLAQAGRKVALVDADLRRPRAHKLFDTPVSPGLVDWMVEGNYDPARRHVILPSGESLELVPAGEPPHNPGELLIGTRLQSVIDELTSFHDHVIIDAAPILPVADTLAIAGRVDGVLFVVDANQARKTTVNETIARLNRVNANIIGIVLNNAKVTASKYKYNSYNYGSAYRLAGDEIPAPASKKSRRRRKQTDGAKNAMRGNEQLDGGVASALTRRERRRSEPDVWDEAADFWNEEVSR